MKPEQIIEKLGLIPSNKEIKQIEQELNAIMGAIENSLLKEKIKAEVFVGGSFAKATIVKREKYDVDIFVRFEKVDDLDKELEKILKRVSAKMKLPLKLIHGSRNYFAFEKGNLIFEIIPVRKIKAPKEALNSTDLSYFHVNYVKKELEKRILIKDIVLAKTFCRAQNVYGAESWIRGFSGYALECLVIYYKGFEKMLKELANTKIHEKIILDPKKHYKNKHEVLIEMNESKRKSPIVLVDPTYKERNVASALSHETFERFKLKAKAFLKKPDIKFFIKKEVKENEFREEAKNKKLEYAKISIKTDKQEGEIAGAKLEKFYRYLLNEIKKYYEINESIFDFNEKQEANIHLLVKPKKEVFQRGPFVQMKEEALAFKKLHENTFVKDGRFYAPIEVLKINEFLQKFIDKRKDKIREMDVDVEGVRE